MSKKEYKDLMKSILKMQIGYIEEGCEDYEWNEYQQGIVRGLEIAMEKLDASEFLLGEK